MSAAETRPRLQEDWPDPEPADGEVLVELRAAALNRRDLYITQGLYPGVRTPVILGSDGVGALDGKRVLLQPGLDWGNDEAAQSRAYTILGTPRDGTFAEAIAVPSVNVYACPDYLSDEEAAAMPLAGLTAYRALMNRGRARAGDTVLVTGAGGGVASFVIQFAVALGCRVLATSSSDDKLAFAKTLGAEAGVRYTDDDWVEQVKRVSGGIDVVVDGAGGEGFSQLITAMNPGGRMSFYGGTRGQFGAISPQALFWKQLTLAGSTMGSPTEFASMLSFAEAHQIKPVVDSVRPLAELNDAIDRMDAGAQRGKLVVTLR